MIVKHQQPRPMLDEPGERIETEGWIDSSNVALYSEERDGPVRIGHKFVGDGGQLYDTKKEAKQSFDGEVPTVIQKIRVSKQTDEKFDEIQPY
jgi:ribosomal protein L24